MADFRGDFATHADRILDHVGDGNATYTPSGGDPETVKVLVDEDADVIGELGLVTGKRTEIEFLVAEVSEPAKGATVVLGSDSWVLGSLVRRDGITARVVARHA